MTPVNWKLTIHNFHAIISNLSSLPFDISEFSLLTGVWTQTKPSVTTELKIAPRSHQPNSITPLLAVTEPAKNK